jgi:hypothetical protein
MLNPKTDTDLRAENERLLAALVTLQREARHVRLLASARQAECERLRASTACLERRLAQLAAEKADISDEYARIGRQFACLRTIHPAARRLHEAVARANVVQALHEVMSALVAVDGVAVFVRQRERLTLASSSGIDPSRYASIVIGRGRIGRVAARGKPWLSGAAPRGEANAPRLAACLPLVLAGRVAGVVAVFLSPSRERSLSATDHEILAMIAAHGAIALQRCTTIESAVRHRAAAEYVCD